MKERANIKIAAKCAPEEKILKDIQRASLEAVEIYLSSNIISNTSKVIRLCKKFPFKYSIHAHNDGYDPQALLELSEGIGAHILVFHDIYWEDEWRVISKIFQHSRTKPCVENVYSVIEVAKIARRYGFGKCLDLEHMQLAGLGVYEEVVVENLRDASHIHLSGYVTGSQLWHTHIHYSPGHNMYMLNLLVRAGYKGFVVSEAKRSLQTYEEFKRLNDFFLEWQSKEN